MARKRLSAKVLASFAVLALTAAACGGTDPETGTDGGTTDGTTDGTAMEGDGVLTIGTLLPETGSLAFLGPPEVAGADLAVQEINAAGGVLGKDVVLIPGDSGDTTTDIANQTVDRLLAANVDAIIGAASSSVSFTVIDKIVNAGVIEFSPANTSKKFSTYDDKGLYFRTAPSDILQGQVLGSLIVEDGNQSVVIMALQDPYGEGLAEDMTVAIESSGGTVLETIIYDPQAQNFDPEVQKVVDANPDAIAVIGFDETARILTALHAKGFGPADKPVYGSDGNMGNALAEQFADSLDVLAGFKGTTPLSELDDSFKDKLLAVNPDLQDFNYAAETYDAIVVVALGAELAKSDSGVEIAKVLQDVTGGGTKCTSFAECRDLIAAGTDIDYDGFSGPIDLDDVGDPSSASFAILQFNAEGVLDTLEYRIAGK